MITNSVIAHVALDLYHRACFGDLFVQRTSQRFGLEHGDVASRVAFEYVPRSE
jgi:hypothetical protein